MGTVPLVFFQFLQVAGCAFVYVIFLLCGMACPFILQFWHNHLGFFVVVVFKFYVYGCFACVLCMYTMCVPNICIGQRRVSDPLGLELELVVIVIFNPEELSPDSLEE